MMLCDKVREIKTKEEFSKIMNSNEDIKLFVSDDEDNFMMLLNPYSSRFKGCFSQVIYTDEGEKMTEFHYEKKGSNFVGFFEDVIKNAIKGKVYEVKNMTDIAIIQAIQ